MFRTMHYSLRMKEASMFRTIHCNSLRLKEVYMFRTMLYSLRLKEASMEMSKAWAWIGYQYLLDQKHFKHSEIKNKLCLFALCNNLKAILKVIVKCTGGEYGSNTSVRFNKHET